MQRNSRLLKTLLLVVGVHCNAAAEGDDPQIDAACSKLGFQAGTADFANCKLTILMRLSQDHEARAERREQYMNRQNDILQGLGERLRRNRPQNCDSVTNPQAGGGFATHTTCY